MLRYSDCIQLIASLGEANPEKGILLVNTSFQESSYSYPDLLRRVQALAHQFHAQGVRQSHKVLIALSTEIDAICSFLALIYLGAVPFSVSSPVVSQDRGSHRRRIAQLVTRHGIDRILVSEDLAGIAGLSREIPLEMELASRSPDAPGMRNFRTVEPLSVAPDDVAFVQFSSGSTSHPKGVQITHRNLLHNLGLIVENDRRTEQSVMASWLPLSHDMGLVGCLLSNLIYKNDLVLMDPLCFMTRPISWLAAISRMRGTMTAIPNFALDICTDRVTDGQLREHSVDLSSLRYVYNGSERVHLKSIRRFEEKFERYGFVPGSIYPVYGMTEATLIISAPKYEESVVAREIDGTEVPSVGYPLGNFEMRVRDDGGGDLGTEQSGEVWVRGTSLSPGYLPPSEGHGGLTRGGWLATGDLGLLDRDGRLYITGRKKDLIIYQGRNFYGHDIAARIEELPYVRKGKVFVFGVNIDQGEKVVVMTAPPKERPKARGLALHRMGPHEEKAPLRLFQSVLRGVSSEGSPGNLEDYKAAIRKLVLQEFGLPVHDVHIVERLPKTTSGKVARHRCAQIYLDSLEKASSGGP